MTKYVYVFFISLLVLLLYSKPSTAEQWAEDFEKICSQTEIANDLSTEELETLLEESDKLMEVIKASDNPRKKTYIFRLSKCRKFFEYSLGLRGQKSGGNQ